LITAGALPQTVLGEITVLPDPLSGFKGPASKGREGGRTGGKVKRGRLGEGRGEKEDFRAFDQFQICHYTTYCESGMVMISLISVSVILQHLQALTQQVHFDIQVHLQNI